MSYIENRKGWFLVMSGLIIILMTFCIAPGSASPQLPCEFYGTATNGGTPVAVGTEITAYVNGVKQGSIRIKETGKYGGTGTFDERLIVLSGENDFSGGAPMITFKIGDTVTDQSVQYTPGTSAEMALTTGGSPVVVKPGAGSQPSSQTPTVITPMQAQPVTPATSSAVPVQAAAPVVTTAPVSMMQAASVPSSPVQAAPVITAVPTAAVPASSGSPTILSISTQVPVNISSATAVPAVTMVPVNATSVKTVAPVMTTAPTAVPTASGSASILSVSTQVPVNNTSTTSVQKTENQTSVPVVTSAPVVPVKTAAPVAVVTPANSNQTNVTANSSSSTSNLSTSSAPATTTTTVSFPSGQTINK
nr:hypothetical protein [uncultured Methanospirillum sp.]